MTLPPDVIAQLVTALAEELAPRIAAELASSMLKNGETSQPWRLYDLEEAAAMLGRSTRWVRQRAKRGELPFVKLDGGALAFELVDLQAFAQVRRISAGAGSVLATRLQGNGDRAADAGSAEGDRLGRLRVKGA